MLTLECYWYDASNSIDPKQRKTFSGECVGELIQQAFLQKMAVRDWVGYTIVDAEGNYIIRDFHPSAVIKKLWATE